MTPPLSKPLDETQRRVKRRVWEGTFVNARRQEGKVAIALRGYADPDGETAPREVVCSIERTDEGYRLLVELGREGCCEAPGVAALQQLAAPVPLVLAGGFIPAGLALSGATRHANSGRGRAAGA